MYCRYEYGHLRGEPEARDESPRRKRCSCLDTTPKTPILTYIIFVVFTATHLHPHPYLSRHRKNYRVTVTLAGSGKHRLPTSPENCSVVHGAGIPSPGVCTFSDGRLPTNYAELSHCVREAACPVIDHKHQMVVFRDPRPLVVSAYFYLSNLKRTSGTADDYVMKMLPTYTQWVAVRYIIFEGEGSNGELNRGRSCLPFRIAWQFVVGWCLPTATVVLVCHVQAMSVSVEATAAGSAGRICNLH